MVGRMSMEQDEALDLQIYEAIQRMREEHNACNGDELSRVMNVDRGVIGERLAYMKRQGMVDWTHVNGSVVPLVLGEEPLPAHAGYQSV